jgi:hypothetical protein
MRLGRAEPHLPLGRVQVLPRQRFRFDVEVADVSGDLAYTVGYERVTASIDGGPLEALTVRVTHVYRREDGEWKIVHRHGDIAPVDQSPPKDRRAALPPLTDSDSEL